MVVAEEMSKATLKVTVSDSDSSSAEESEKSGDDVDMEEEAVEADAESDSSGENDTETGDLIVCNEGWADAVAKVLGSTKPKNKKTLVLSRAKKFTEVVKEEKEEKPEFEVIGDEIEAVKQKVKKQDPKDTEPVLKKKKLEKPSIRVKPNILEKDRERLLSKIATKGVVQLFNAVRKQQKVLETDMNREDLTESKKEKILKKFDKRTFLDSLMGNTKSVIVDEAKKVKNELKTEDEKPKWSALRDDFMMGAKMKDWDKESVDE